MTTETHLRPAAPFDFAAPPIKGSRFLACVRPVQDEQGANAALDGVRAAHPDASHHCWAYRLASGIERSSDDGEPGGSAGRPILAQLAGHGVADTLVVVARWFGGTKLGVGGLIRAYGGTAGQALDRAPLEAVHPTVTLRLRYAYDDTNAVDGALAAVHHTTIDTTWGADVVRVVRVEAPLAPSLVEALRERSGDRVDVAREDEPGGR